MNPFGELLDLVLQAIGRLQAAGDLPEVLDLGRVAVEPPRDPAHGEAAPTPPWCWPRLPASRRW